MLVACTAPFTAPAVTALISRTHTAWFATLPYAGCRAIARNVSSHRLAAYCTGFYPLVYPHRCCARGSAPSARGFLHCWILRFTCPRTRRGILCQQPPSGWFTAPFMRQVHRYLLHYAAVLPRHNTATYAFATPSFAYRHVPVFASSLDAHLLL